MLHFNQGKMTVLELQSARNKVSSAASAQLAWIVRKRYVLRKQMTALKLWWNCKALVYTGYLSYHSYNLGTHGLCSRI